MSGQLDVVVCNEHDAVRAEQGGADSVELVGSFDDDWYSPDVDLVERTCNRVDIPVRPLARLRPGFRTDGGEVTRLRGLISAYFSAGARGVVLGFLDGYSGIDVEVTHALVDDIGFPWTLDRAFDHTLDPQREWHKLDEFPTLDRVLTAGSAIDVGHGLDLLIQAARNNRQVASLAVAAGHIVPENVPWLVRAGITKFQIRTHARPQGDMRAGVDADLVGSWRDLIDDEIARVR